MDGALSSSNPLGRASPEQNCELLSIEVAGRDGRGDHQYDAQIAKRCTAAAGRSDSKE
jgi:hypothetical protein